MNSDMGQHQREREQKEEGETQEEKKNGGTSAKKPKGEWLEKPHGIHNA